MKRRHFLQSSLAAALLTGRTAYAGGAEKKFIFVFNAGGWDPTRVFADEFENPHVDLEPLAQREQVGAMSFVSHPDRPSVSQFFQVNADDLVVCNGVHVRSIAHEICTLLTMTGSPSGQKPGWAATLAAQAQGTYALPHLVVGGPSFPGPFGASVARSGSNGQLDRLLSAEILQMSDIQVNGAFSRAQRFILDDYIVQRARAYRGMRTTGRGDRLSSDFLTSQKAATELQDYSYLMNFNGAVIEDEFDVAVEALKNGVSRCVTVSGARQSWDTHADNDAQQSVLFEDLFTGLRHLKLRLESTIGPSGAPLSEETVVVVLSEMGRTPQLNGTNGKDHWPNTSLLLWGPNIPGGRVIGGYDDTYAAKRVNPLTGDLSDQGLMLSVEMIGGALLTLGDVDPTPYLPDSEPLLRLFV